MVEGQKARDATSCQSEPQRGCQREDKELSPHSKLCHHGKCQCKTVITSVRLKSSWAFPESCVADDSGSEHLSNGGPRSTLGQCKSLCCCLSSRNAKAFTSGSTIPTMSHDRTPLVYPVRIIRITISFSHVWID